MFKLRHILSMLLIFLVPWTALAEEAQQKEKLYFYNTLDPESKLGESLNSARALEATSSGAAVELYFKILDVVKRVADLDGMLIPDPDKRHRFIDPKQFIYGRLAALSAQGASKFVTEREIIKERYRKALKTLDPRPLEPYLEYIFFSSLRDEISSFLVDIHIERAQFRKALMYIAFRKKIVDGFEISKERKEQIKILLEKQYNTVRWMLSYQSNKKLPRGSVPEGREKSDVFLDKVFEKKSEFPPLKTIIHEGGFIFYDQKYISAYNQSGFKQWEKKIRVSSPVVYENKIYFLKENNICILDIAGGEWTFINNILSDGLSVIPKLFIYNHQLYTVVLKPNGDSYLFRYDLENKNLRNTHYLGTFTTPPSTEGLEADKQVNMAHWLGKLVILSSQGGLFFLDMEAGGIETAVILNQARDFHLNVNTMLIANGLLYVTSHPGNKLLAFDVSGSLGAEIQMRDLERSSVDALLGEVHGMTYLFKKGDQDDNAEYGISKLFHNKERLINAEESMAPKNVGILRPILSQQYLYMPDFENPESGPSVDIYSLQKFKETLFRVIPSLDFKPIDMKLYGQFLIFSSDDETAFFDLKGMGDAFQEIAGNYKRMTTIEKRMEYLLSHLSHDTWGIHFWAKRTLAEMGLDISEVLLTSLNTFSPLIKTEVEEALHQILLSVLNKNYDTLPSEKQDALINLLIWGYYKILDAKIRKSVLTSFGKTKNPRALIIVLAALEDDEKEIRLQAIHALEPFAADSEKKAQVRAVLERRFKKEKEADVRHGIVACLIHFLSKESER